MDGRLSKMRCPPCGKSELDIQGRPPVQVSIVEDYALSVGSRSTLDSGAPLDFEIPASGDDWLDLGSCVLSLGLRVLKGDGTYLAAGDNPSLVNNIGHSLFNQVEFYMNDTLVSTSNNCYPYKSYLTYKLGYGDEVKSTWLERTEGWIEDTPGAMDQEANAALIKRRRLIAGSRLLQLKVRPQVDMIMQERLIPNQVSCRLKFHLAQEAFSLMCFEDNPNYKIRLESATLEVRRCKLANEQQLSLERVLSTQGAVYPIARVETKHFTLPAGVTSINLDSVFVGPIPSLLVAGLVTNTAFTGDFQQNPFNFQHFDASMVYLTADGRQIPSKAWDMNFGSDNYLDPYFGLLRATGIHPRNTSNALTYEDYGKGSCLYAFDLTPDLAASFGHVSPTRYGTVMLHLRFRRALTSTVTAVVMGQFPGEVRLDRTRTVSTDYSI